MSGQVLDTAIQSTLELAVHALPDDFVMKGISLPNYLKKASTPLTGKQLKDEELFQVGLDSESIDPARRFSKQDLIDFITNRPDYHRVNVIAGEDTSYKSTTLKEVVNEDYEEAVYRHYHAGHQKTGRTNPTHFYDTHGIDDTLLHTRRNPMTLENHGRGRVVFEIQSDPHQYGRRYGYSLKDKLGMSVDLPEKLEALRASHLNLSQRITAAKQVLRAYQLGAIDEFGNSLLVDATIDPVSSARYTFGDEDIDVGKIKEEYLDLFERRDRLASQITKTETGAADARSNVNSMLTREGRNLHNQWRARYSNLTYQDYLTEAEYGKFSPGLAEELGKYIAKADGNYNEFDEDAFTNGVQDFVKNGSLKHVTEWLDIIWHRGNEVPDNLPFKNDWLDKGLEREMVDAVRRGYNFIAIPIEVADHQLVRGPGVQKWYENTVRPKIAKTVKALNRGILQRNPNAGHDELFHIEQTQITPIGNIGRLRDLPEDFGARFKEDPQGTVEHLLHDIPATELRDGLSDAMETDEALRTAINNTIGPFELVMTKAGHSQEVAQRTYAEGLQKHLLERFKDQPEALKHWLRTHLPTFDSRSVGRLPKLDAENPHGHLMSFIYNSMQRGHITEFNTIGIIDELSILKSDKDWGDIIHEARVELGQGTGEYGGDALDKYYRKLAEGAAELMLENMTPAQIDKQLLDVYFDSSQRNMMGSQAPRAHVLETIIFPKKYPIINQVPRGEHGKATIKFTDQTAEDFAAGTPIDMLDKMASDMMGWGEEYTKASEPNRRWHWFNMLTGSLEGMTDKQIDQVAKIAQVRATEVIPERLPFEMPEWVADLRLYSAAPGVVSVEAIHEALKDPELTNRNIHDYLVNKMDMDSDDVSAVIDKAMRENIAELMNDGLTSYGVYSALQKRGFLAEDIFRWLPKETYTEKMIDWYMKQGQITADIAREGVEFFLGIPTEDPTPELVAARAIAANETVGKLINDISAPFDREMWFHAKSQHRAINQQVMEALEAHGMGAALADNGDILIPDENGQMVPLTVDLWDSLKARNNEVILAVGASLALAKRVPGPWWVKGLAAAGGSAVGASTGRGADMVRNMLYNKQVIEDKFIYEEMLKTGALDPVLGVVGWGAFKLGEGSFKLLRKSWEYIKSGNPDGANKALLDILHLQPEDAQEIVRQWEHLNNVKAPGRTEAMRNLAVIPRVHPDAYTLVGPASKYSSMMSANVAREIDTRAKNLIKSIEGTSNERTGAILADELPDFERKVTDSYNGTKYLGAKQLENSGYKFDFHKLVMLPVLDASIRTIDNPQVRDQARRLFSRIKRIGEREIPTAGGGTQIIETRRTFGDLLELRGLVLNFKQNKTKLKNADTAAIDLMLKNIDREITSAARKGMPESKNWLEAWDKSKQAMDNLTELRTNLLFKAITKSGATDATILSALAKYANSVDGTYRQVIQALPKRLVPPVESAVMRETVEKYTVGDTSGRQAIDFVALDTALKNIPFTSNHNRQIKQGIGELARVFRNDPHLMAASGTVKSPSFQTYLTTDPRARLQYAVASETFNYAIRLLPTERGREAALITNIARYLARPQDSVAMEELIKNLPPDPALRNSLRQKAAEIAAWNAKSVFPRVEVYGSAAEGHSRTPVDGPLGRGIYYSTDKIKQRAISRRTGGKLSTELIHPDRIADHIVIRELLDIPEGTAITAEMIKNHPDLRQQLMDRAYSGVILGDQILVF